jgi:hypothetical protein
MAEEKPARRVTRSAKEVAYGAIPGFLRDSVAGFRDSLEWRMLARSQSMDEPALVAGAFTDFLIRIEETSCAEDSLTSAYDAIERITVDGHESLVADEIFRNVDATRPDTLRAFEAKLRPASAALFARWREKNPVSA